jgi:hypothetical protein
MEGCFPLPLPTLAMGKTKGWKGIGGEMERNEEEMEAWIGGRDGGRDWGEKQAYDLLQQ